MLYDSLQTRVLSLDDNVLGGGAHFSDAAEPADGMGRAERAQRPPHELPLSSPLGSYQRRAAYLFRTPSIPRPGCGPVPPPAARWKTDGFGSDIPPPTAGGKRKRRAGIFSALVEAPHRTLPEFCSRHLQVTGLSPATTREKLRSYANHFGPTNAVYMHDEQGAVWANVQFFSALDCERFLRQMAGCVLDQRRLEVGRGTAMRWGETRGQPP
jgi:hypothetical protein